MCHGGVDLGELRAAVGDALVVAPDVVDGYRLDRAHFCPAGVPLGLVRARSRDDVVATLRWASAHRVPVVPQGARTGLSGGANAVDGCLLLSLDQMTAIRAIDPVERIAVVEPGVRNADLTRACWEHGLTYPPDPSSWEISTIGGNVATNAGGLCCVKYGVTREYVRALEVVLADGRVLRTGTATAKGVAGYDLTSLLVGSEGTLGVVTEVTVRLVPRPADPLTAVAFFGSARGACETVLDHRASGARPSMLELMDRGSLEAVARLKDLGFPEGTGAMLLVQSDDPDRAGAELDAFAEVARRRGGEVVVAEDREEAELLVEARRLFSPAHAALGTDLVDDVCVPLTRLADLVDGVEAIGREHDVAVMASGHAGDGNMHPVVVFDGGDPASAARAEAAFAAIMRLGIALGGTITGEHGVGRLKVPFLGEEVDRASVDVHRAIKSALDPLGILNPGVVLGP